MLTEKKAETESKLSKRPERKENSGTIKKRKEKNNYRAQITAS